MRTDDDYSERAVVQGLTLYSMIHFSGSLLPANSTFGVCPLLKCLGGALVWSEGKHQVC